MRAKHVPSKYGITVTGDDWRGFPLRLGSFATSGRTEGLIAREDTVLLWSGGRSDVTIHARSPGSDGATTLRFARHNGVIDFIPKGTALEDVVWQGQTHDCVSVSFDRALVETLLGGAAPTLPVERGLRLNVIDAHVVDLVRRLEAQAVQDSPGGPLYVEGLTLTLASYVYGRYAAAPAKVDDAPLPALAAEKLVAFVEGHLAGDIGLADLARLVGYSPDYLARVFKKTFGVSPYQYVLRRRVDRAKTLLRDRSLSIAEIAMASGFTTQSHFSAVFKAQTGLTPGAYRRG